MLHLVLVEPTEGKTMTDIDLSKSKNTTVKDMWNKLQEMVKPLTEIQQKIKAASPPSVLELDKELNSSEDPVIAEYRAEIKRLEEAVKVAREDAHQKMIARYQTIPEAELEDLKKAFAAQHSDARTTLGMLRDYATIFKVTEAEEALKDFKLPDLRGQNKVGQGANADSAPRPKVTAVTVTRADGKSKTTDTLSAAALFAKQATADVLATWLKEAGASEWQEVSETLTVELDGVTYEITPKVHE